MRELILKKCLKCNSLIKIIEERGQITCCNAPMTTVIANSVDASFEKHVPTYTIENGLLKVCVNHVMEDDHYIEWLMILTDNMTYEINLKPGDNPELVIPYTGQAILYSYCNKHGLWTSKVQ